MTKPIFFKSLAVWRAWLDKNHAGKTEVLVGLYKKGSGKTGITYKEAVDGALAYGWIDGKSQSIDDKRYMQRFTPRTKRSIWSAINIARIEEFKKRGLMHPAGLKAFETRDPKRTNLYSFEQAKIEFPPEFEKRFRANKKAWTWFEKMTPSYRRPATWWVISARKEETKERRLGILIADSAAGRRIAPLTPTGTKKMES